MTAYAYKPEVSDYATRGGQAAARAYRRRGKKTMSQSEYRKRSREELRLNKTPELTTWDIKYELWVVRGADLAAIVCDWIERRGMELQTGCLYIASELGCHEDVVYKLRKKEWVSFTFADALLVVIGQHFSLINGDVPYYANPYMSRKAWYAKARADGIKCPAEAWIISNPALS